MGQLAAKRARKQTDLWLGSWVSRKRHLVCLQGSHEMRSFALVAGRATWPIHTVQGHPVLCCRWGGLPYALRIAAPSAIVRHQLVALIFQLTRQ